MHEYACDYAKVLNLHNLDAPSVTISGNETTVDADRKHFWELVQIDFMFRLLLDRPPLLTESIMSWNSNLPWLSGTERPDLTVVSIATFLMGVRLSFILSQFFQVLESPDYNETSALSKTEEYCIEIDQILLEYQLVRRTSL